MVKRLASCIREYKKDSILTPLFVTIEVIIEVIIPLLMANLIDLGIEKGSMSYILKMGLALVISACLSLAFGALSGRSAAKASAGFARNLRHDMYHNVQNFSFANIDRYSTAGLITRLTSDVTNVQNAFQMVIRIAVRAPVMLVFSMIMSFGINAELSLVFLCAIPILAVALWFIMTKVHPMMTRVFKTYDKLNNTVQENIRAIRVVKSFVREDHEIEKFDAVSKSIYTDFSKAEKILAFNMPLMQFCMYGCTLAISWIGAHLIVGSSMSTGQLVSIIAYASQILMSLMILSMVLVMITIARTSGERITEVLEERSDLCNPERPVFEVADGSVRFDNVDFSYGGDPQSLSLAGVNLDIRSGETIGIIGGTGTSKTTLVQLIPRLYDATSGSVSVGGRNVRDYDLDTLRNSVAMVLQKNELFSGTISENLRWGCPDASEEKLRHVCRLAQADEFISALPGGYEYHVEQGGTNVSGGQKQRLCIARALLKKPKILILDDSTSAVDTKTDALIRKAFREEIPDTTKFIIAQRIASVQDADRIIVMDGGRVAAFGSHEELMKGSEMYRSVYNSQTESGGSDE